MKAFRRLCSARRSASNTIPADTSAHEAPRTAVAQKAHREVSLHPGLMHRGVARFVGRVRGALPPTRPEWCARGGIRTHTAPKDQHFLRVPRATSFRHPGATSGYGADLTDVPAAVGGGLCVAVRADDSQISQPIVISSPVEVVQLQRDRESVPAIKATSLAPWLLQPLFDQSPLQLVGLHMSSINEHLVDGAGRNNRRGRPPAPGLPHEV